MQTDTAAKGSLNPLRHLVWALLLVLLAILLPLQASAKDDVECAYELDLKVQEMDEPGLDEMLFSGFAGERYFLLLDGELLVAAENEEALTQLVWNVAESYVNSNTISCGLADPERLSLCYGGVSVWAESVLETAEQRLYEELEVVTVDRVVTEETIPYQQVQAEDPERYEDEDPVITPGADGKQEVTTETRRINGKTVSTEVETEVLIPVTDEVTTVGTKVRPEYIWPADGTVSSHFGPRNIAIGSKNHKGVDIAVSYGSDVVAAKAGTVIYSQWNSGGYGYLVKIEHEDGDVTYYAHNSALVAAVGDVVEQGQVIAKAGSTGNSSGTHCHFEIRIDGTPVDPEDYLEAQ